MEQSVRLHLCQRKLHLGRVSIAPNMNAWRVSFATEREAFSLYEPFVQILKGRQIKHAATNSVKYALGHNELPNFLGIRGSNECQRKERRAEKSTKSSAVGKAPADA